MSKQATNAEFNFDFFFFQKKKKSLNKSLVILGAAAV